jgi:Icc protein
LRSEGILGLVCRIHDDFLWHVARIDRRPERFIRRRRGFLGLGGGAMAATPTSGELTFVQIRDSHIGFSNPPNTDTPGTLREAIERVTQLKGNSSLLLHTGDVSQLSRAGQFDTAEQIIKSAGLDTHYVPGEHDVLDDDGKAFFERFTKRGQQGLLQL